MKCPSCGNNQATCVINNYWDCPSPGCKNYSGTSGAKSTSKSLTAIEFDRLARRPVPPPGWYGGPVVYPPLYYGGKPTPLAPAAQTNTANTIYSGSPWQPGQYKVAVGCIVRQPGTEFNYWRGSALYDTWADAGKAVRCTPGSGYADYVVELVSLHGTHEWRIRIVHELP